MLLGHSNESAERERLYVDLLHAEAADGIILPTVREGLSEKALGTLPVVFVDRVPDVVTSDTVVADGEQGAYDAAVHLARLGHRRIGFVGGLAHLSTSRTRLAGYRRGLADAGLPYDEALVRAGDSRLAGGRERAGALLDLPEPPSALFVGNNLMTLGALEAIRARGLRIPDEVAIIGFDDMPWAAAFNPPLTAVHQPGYEIGRQATELLLRRLREPDAEPELIVLPTTLVVRGSCGAR